MDLGEVAQEKGAELVDAMLMLLAENQLMVKTAGIMSAGDLRIAAGAWADLVVFDPSTIGNRSTVEQPAQFPTGIEYVLVNGKVTIAGEEYRDTRAGQVLRKGRS
jgi:N-acyl-D-aspartate/D-glutamate deacylase